MDFYTLTNMIYLMANLQKLASSESLVMLFKLIDQNSEGSSKLVDEMKLRMKEPEKRKNMPNLISHLYWSLTELEIDDEVIVSEIEKCIKELIPELELKNIVTLLEGIGKRRKNSTD